MTWEGLSPPYATIVADPPWHYGKSNWAPFSPTAIINNDAHRPRRGLRYSTMSSAKIAALPVAELAAEPAHLYLWVTNRYIPDAYRIAEAWGFRPSQLLTWCKPLMGVGPGGAFTQTTEHVLFCHCGKPRRGRNHERKRAESTWFLAKRGSHSAKPPAFLDLVEQVSPAPRVELFARAQRLGWDSWGWGYEGMAG